VALVDCQRGVRVLYAACSLQYRLRRPGSGDRLTGVDANFVHSCFSWRRLERRTGPGTTPALTDLKLLIRGEASGTAHSGLFVLSLPPVRNTLKRRIVL